MFRENKKMAHVAPLTISSDVGHCLGGDRAPAMSTLKSAFTHTHIIANTFLSLTSTQQKIPRQSGRADIQKSTDRG